MGSPTFITRHLNQTLVYWKKTGNDGEGGFEYATPEDLNGRCEFKVEQVLSALGEEKVSRARVFLEQEVEEGGYLYLGSLDDSNMDSAPLPETTEGSMRIIAFETIPRLDGPGNLYKAFCNMD